MENNVVSIKQHKKYRRPTLWLPDRPECQVYDCKRLFREMRKEGILEAQRLRLRKELQKRSEQYPEFYEDEF
jgi:hypothetical protein